MRANLNSFQQIERKMVSEKKVKLPVHAGESRYQLALDSDRNFREMILAAFAIALFAASGFGQAASTMGPIRTALLCMASAGFGLRIVALRFASQGVGTGLVDGPNTRLIGVVMGGFGVLGSFLGGGYGLQAICGALAYTALTLIVTRKAGLRLVIYFSVGIGLTGLLTWIIGFSGSGPDLLSASMALSICAFAMAVSFLSNWNQATAMQPAMVLTSFASYGWIVLTAFTVVHSVWAGPVALVAIMLFAVIERLISDRATFAPIIVLLVGLHLSAFFTNEVSPTRLIAPHLTALIFEFCLLGMAGYRHAIAALNRFPLATYRSSPQCLVPTLDHAWDHPVKIDAA